MKKRISQIISRTCIMYAAVSFLWLAAASALAPEIIPALNLVQEAELFLFSVIFSSFLEILTFDKLKMPVRYILHFLISYLDFLLVFALIGKNFSSFDGAVIISVCFVAVYILFAIIYHFAYVRGQEKQKIPEYKSMLEK